MKKRDFVDPVMEEAVVKMMDDPDLIEKIMSDEVLDDEGKSRASGQRPVFRRQVARVRNRAFRHGQWKKFLSASPSLDPKDIEGLDCYNAVFAGGPYRNINLSNHLFISRRGDIRVLRGKTQLLGHGAGFVTGPSSFIREMRKNTNRYVRHMPVSEDNCNSWNYYRKLHSEEFD